MTNPDNSNAVSQQPSTPEASDDRLHILYVDDSKFDRELVRHVLEREHGGFRITEAASQQEFETRLQDGTYDLVLTDFNILGFEGFHVLDQVRAFDPHLPVVIVTGTGSEEVAVEAMKRGVGDYVIKTPKHIQRLPNTILSAIEKKRLQQERMIAISELQARARQQAVVAELGQRALAGLDLITLESEAAILVAETLKIPFSEVLLFHEDGLTLNRRASYGMDRRDPALDLRSDGLAHQIQLALSLKEPIMVEDLAHDDRFLNITRLHNLDITSGMSVLIQGTNQPFGILCGYAVETTTFIQDDINFLLAVANVMASAIERKAFEKQVIEARDKAEEMSRLKTSFLTNMSHEIRTPLTGIIGFASILSNEVPVEFRELTHIIEQSGQRLLTTLNSILDLSMLEAGSLRLNCRPLQVQEEITEKLQLLRPLAEQKGLLLSVEMRGAERVMEIDPTFLDRIINNLVGNAIKFTEQGHISLTVQTDDQGLELRVEDTGVGISPSFLPHLFDAFKQEQMGLTRSHEGTGLGLTVTKRLVDLMGGSIVAESAKGQGSVFTVWIPQPILDLEPLAEQRPLVPFTIVASQGNRQRLLVVEDNPEMLLLVRHFLGEAYDVATAEDEETALAHARQHDFDAVLMDINLGRERTGVDVLRDLRTIPGYEAVPVAAVTAYALPGDREYFLRVGFNTHVGKPFTKKLLHEAVLLMLSTEQGQV